MTRLAAVAMVHRVAKLCISPARALDGSEDVGTVIHGTYHSGVPPEPNGGRLLPGMYVLNESHVYLSTDDFPPVTVNVEQITLDVGGVLRLNSVVFISVDLNGVVHALTTSGMMSDGEISVSFSGNYATADNDEP
jgi:hypothetical protein